MTDLIRKRDAVSAISDLLMILDWKTPTWNEVYRAIQALPSAEPEREKGKWIDGMLYYDFDESEWEKVKCSVCKNYVTKQIFYHDNKYHYCPYCGADMRGE